MLGEHTILGAKEVTIDDKGRTIIPKFAYPTPNEEVVFTIEDRNSFYISSLVALEKLLKQLELECSSVATEREIKELERRIQNIYNTAFGTDKLDKFARVIVPKFVRNQIIFPNGEEEKSKIVIAQGNGYRLRYFKNMDEYYKSFKKASR